jgi:hypothetical protein
MEIEAKARTSDPQRLSGVKNLGVDEHIWRLSKIGVDRAVTIMVDLSRDRTDACMPGCWMPLWAAPDVSTKHG